MSGADGPPIIRPIPRRPFDLNVSSPTPPDDDSTPPTPSHSDLHLAASRLLDPRPDGGPDQGSSMSRAQSILNLTSSTLFGIYSPTASGRGLGGGGGGGGGYNDREEPGTPWGTGAQTPAKRLSVDEPMYELMKDRGALFRRRTMQGMVPPARRPTRTSMLWSLTAKATLLFALGMGYGALVLRLQKEPGLAGFQMEGIVSPQGYEWRGLAFWGVSGIVLGTLLPWFDGIWDSAVGREQTDQGDAVKDENPDTDWALVMRSIGAFAGIVYAIRRLPWASTMQVSLSLALVNPFLWYLIDRSISGFLLSFTVGLTGSAILMGLSPDMMPAPAHAAGSFYRNASSTSTAAPLVLGGLARQETLEMGIWMLSVLFCSCVCFGNIGRRLALSRSARGRWGDVR